MNIKGRAAGIRNRKQFLSTPPGKVAQMEMIGLVVIVILITLGMLFMAQFALKEEPHKKVFTRKGLASSAMASIMKTTLQEPNCEGLQLEGDLLEDCAEGFKFGSYYQSRRPYCGGKNSCEFLEEFVPELLNKTLGSWNKRYHFESILVSTGERLFDGEKFSSARGSCIKRERDTSGSFFLNTDVGLVESVLYLCD